MNKQIVVAEGTFNHFINVIIDKDQAPEAEEPFVTPTVMQTRALYDYWDSDLIRRLRDTWNIRNNAPRFKIIAVL